MSYRRIKSSWLVAGSRCSRWLFCWNQCTSMTCAAVIIRMCCIFFLAVIISSIAKYIYTSPIINTVSTRSEDCQSDRAVLSRVAMSDTRFMKLPQPENWQIPRVVHYAWCQTSRAFGRDLKMFEFHHFLTVKSILRFLNPDVVFVHYNVVPAPDRLRYNTWFDELRDLSPLIVRLPMNGTDMCTDVGDIREEYILKHFVNPDSIYVGEHTLFARTPSDITQHNVINSLDFMQKGGYISVGKFASRPSILTPPDPEKHRRCMIVKLFEKGTSPPCVLFPPTGALTMDAIRYRMMKPQDIWRGNGSFTQLCRNLMYGKDEEPHPILHPTPVIPRLAHYVWFGGGEMDFLFYLSVLSCLYILNLDEVYVHGDYPPSGPLWTKANQLEHIHWVYRRRTRVVFEQPLDHVEHEADIAAVNIVGKYGGLHVDPDLLFWQPFPEIYWRYDSVAAPNRKSSTYYPYYINIGMYMARPGSPYWRMVEEGEQDFQQLEWNWNSARLLYKIYERNPETLMVSPYLQVMCAGEVYNDCMPHWPEATDPIQWSKNVSDWINMTYCYHLNKPTPPELFTFEATIGNTTVFSRMGQKVLEAAGLYKPKS